MKSTRTKDIKFDIKTNELSQNTLLEKLTDFRVLPVAILAVVVIVGSFYASWKHGYELDKNRQKIAHIATLRQLSERIEKSALQARSGSALAFNELRYSENNIDSLLKVLQNGGKIKESDNEIDQMIPEFSLQFNKVTSEWNQNKSLIDALIAQEKNIVNLKTQVTLQLREIQNVIDASSAFQKQIEKMNNTTDNRYAQELVLLSNRINQGLTNLFSGESFSLENGYILVKDLRVFANIIDMFENGSEVYGVTKITEPALLPFLQDLKNKFAPMSGLSQNIVGQVATLNNAKDVALQVSNASKNIVATAGELDSSFTDRLNNSTYYKLASQLLVAFGIILFLLIALVFYEKEKKAKRLGKIMSKNQNNQEAVNLLLQQIEPMDNGDFTKDVHISDKFVMQIANQIDKTRKIFANIVKQLKESSSFISQNAESTDNSSKQLLEVFNKLSEQLSDSIAKIGNITAEMDEVAQKTWFAQEESEQSRLASQEGDRLVSASIDKMNIIRENIQESAKKIKKSSESAQAISEVTSLLQNITKKIEILAVNAAIRAASSGEAGKEFTVVAQEVQRLAFDSKKSTKEIQELIKEVQIDISVAVDSMEKTTIEVVEGAKLTNDAGKSLKRIEELSQEVANKIAEASTKLEAKSEDMTKVSLEMQELQETTVQSKDIINVTASKVEEMKKTSNTLAQTVSIYKVE